MKIKWHVRSSKRFILPAHPSRIPPPSPGFFLFFSFSSCLPVTLDVGDWVADSKISVKGGREGDQKTKQGAAISWFRSLHALSECLDLMPSSDFWLHFLLMQVLGGSRDDLANWICIFRVIFVYLKESERGRQRSPSGCSLPKWPQ